MLLAFSDPELHFFGRVGGLVRWVGGWLEKLKLRLISAKVEVEFEAELGKIKTKNNISDKSKVEQNHKT